MTCPEYRASMFLSLWDVPLDRRVAMIQHVRQCASCWRETILQTPHAEAEKAAASPSERARLEEAVEETLAQLPKDGD
jgi:hypothetical protein